MIRKLIKALLAILVVLVAVITVLVVIAFIVYPNEYVYRILVWQESDVNDYLSNFPNRPLIAADTPFTFNEAPDERVATVLAEAAGVDDWQTFLVDNHTAAFIVIQDGAVVYEQYFNGYARDSLVTSFSVAKSFTSALIGIAIDEGHINSVNDPITDYLPELAERDPGFEEVTIRDLLMMASGFDYDDGGSFLLDGDGPLTSYHPDQRQISLDNAEISAPPGTYFQYNKYHPQLLGLIIERTTGMSVTAYMQEKLWDPLGMEFDGSWSLDSEESGFEKMEAGLNARAIDFAKLGQLYLTNGDWNGTQIVSSEWVAESTQVDAARHHADYYPPGFGEAIYDAGQGYYQYMWYGYFREDGTYDFAAEGDRGQYIYVSRDKDLVIVRNGEEYGIAWDAWIDIFYDFASDW